MDFSHSNTESLLQFHRFHERHNRSIKMQAIAMQVLSEMVEGGAQAADLKDQMYRRDGIWGGMPDWNAAADDIALALCHVGQNGVLRAFSAFDLFLIELQAEIESWQRFSGQVTLLSSDDEIRRCGNGDELERLEGFYQRLGGRTEQATFVWPAYEYFRIARNCIAHREGSATGALVRKSTSSELAVIQSNWVARTGEMHPPAIAPATVDEPINFTHREAISASSILRHLALDIAQLAIKHLGPDGFVYLVARNTFLNETPLSTTSGYSSMVKAFNATIVTRYRVREYDSVEALKILRRVGLTKRCSTRFAAIKRKAKDHGA